MSTTEKTSRPTASPAGHSSTSASRRRRMRGPLALGAGLAVLAAGSVVVGLHEKGTSTSPSTAPATTPLTLPGTLAGLGAMAQSAYTTPAWTAKATAASGGAPIAGRMYGGGGTARSIRAVAARADLTGKLELAWAADAGHAVGGAMCTQNVQLVPGGRVGVRPTVMVCWRKTANLTAYVVVIDPKTTLTDADGGKAIDELWTAVTAAK